MRVVSRGSWSSVRTWDLKYCEARRNQLPVGVDPVRGECHHGGLGLIPRRPGIAGEADGLTPQHFLQAFLCHGDPFVHKSRDRTPVREGQVVVLGEAVHHRLEVGFVNITERIQAPNDKLEDKLPVGCGRVRARALLEDFRTTA